MKVKIFDSSFDFNKDFLKGLNKDKKKGIYIKDLLNSPLFDFTPLKEKLKSGAKSIKSVINYFIEIYDDQMDQLNMYQRKALAGFFNKSSYIFEDRIKIPDDKQDKIHKTVLEKIKKKLPSLKALSVKNFKKAFLILLILLLVLLMSLLFTQNIIDKMIKQFQKSLSNISKYISNGNFIDIILEPFKVIYAIMSIDGGYIQMLVFSILVMIGITVYSMYKV